VQFIAQLKYRQEEKMKKQTQTYRNFTYYIKQKQGFFCTGCQFDSGSGWYFERGGFKTQAMAERYIKFEIDNELETNSTAYDLFK
jgi:hypothetical protein